jgi:hypothetical protein
MNGKGDQWRRTDYKLFKNNYDDIFWDNTLNKLAGILNEMGCWSYAQRILKRETNSPVTNRNELDFYLRTHIIDEDVNKIMEIL